MLLVLVGLAAALSVGGGFFAGVVLAPLLVLVARRASTLGSWGYGLLAGALASEVAWGLTYLVVGEQNPTIWLVPGLVGSATATAAIVTNLREVDAAEM